VKAFGEFRRYRRVCLAKWLMQREQGDATAQVWRGKQLDSPGTALPASFPARAALISAGYEALEDIDGADVSELRANVGLDIEQANSVLTTVARLM
jgi:hypothetical protein